MRIAIVGAGPAGIITAIAICYRLKNKNVTLDIYEPGHPFRGRSFNTGSKHMRLNTSVGISFIDPQKTGGFVDYLNAREQLNVEAGDTVPRDSAVAFLQYEFALARQLVGSVCFIDTAVNDIVAGHDRTPCICQVDKTMPYDAIVIAVGLAFSPLPKTLAHRNVISPYPALQLTEIDRDAVVLLLGSRLSAVDALVHLAGCGHKGRIDIYSRSQLFPCVRQHIIKPQARPFLDQYLLDIETLPQDYSRVSHMLNMLERYLLERHVLLVDIVPAQGMRPIQQLDHEIRNCQQRRNVWEDLVLDIVDGLNWIFQTLPTLDKIRFNNEVNPWLGRIAHSMPLCNALIVSALFRSHQLRMLSTEAFEAIDLNDYEVVVNATGLKSAEADPLLSQLARNNLLRFNGLDGVRIDTGTHRLRSDIPVYANGSIVQGEVFTANSVYSTSYGAEKIALDIEALSRDLLA